MKVRELMMVKNDNQELKVKVSELTDENKRYVIAVAEALLFAQKNTDAKEYDDERSECQSKIRK